MMSDRSFRAATSTPTGMHGGHQFFAAKQVKMAVALRTSAWVWLLISTVMCSAREAPILGLANPIDGREVHQEYYFVNATILDGPICNTSNNGFFDAGVGGTLSSYSKFRVHVPFRDGKLSQPVYQSIIHQSGDTTTYQLSIVNYNGKRRAYTCGPILGHRLHTYFILPLEPILGIRTYDAYITKTRKVEHNGLGHQPFIPHVFREGLGDIPPIFCAPNTGSPRVNTTTLQITYDDNRTRTVPSKRYAEGVHFRIQNVRNSSGHYVCSARNKANKEPIVFNFRVDIEFAPDFTGTQENITGVVGQPLHVRCVVASWPALDISSFRVELPNGSNVSVTPLAQPNWQPQAVTVLNIGRASARHGGLYKCIANNSIGTTVTTVRVTLTVPPCPHLFRHSGHIQCVPCACSANGAESCDDTGNCTCREGFSGSRCQDCASGFYRFGEDCVRCACSVIGARSGTKCNQTTGQCNCLASFSGQQCTYCRDGQFANDIATKQTCVPFAAATTSNPGGCTDCYCSVKGSLSNVCSDGEGICRCYRNYTGVKCDSCISPSQFHTTEGGCQELSEELFTASRDSLVEGDVLDLAHPFVFGSQFTHHHNVSVSLDGYMSLNGFTGGVNDNSFVTEQEAIIAPFWATRSKNLSCSLGKVTTHRVSESVDSATFAAIKNAVKEKYRGDDEFRPREAILTTWLEIPENNQHNKRNTFQAAIISDDCQSFAVLQYPKNGISWKGIPYPVMAAGKVLPTSGTRQVNPIAGVYNLTNGCSKKLRARKHCLDSVTNASAKPQAYHLMTRCPDTKEQASARIIELTRNIGVGLECAIVGGIHLDSDTKISSHCCYGRGGNLIDFGFYRPFQQLSDADSKLRSACHVGGVLSHFFSNRNSPKPADERVPFLMGVAFGDPHLVSFRGKSFDFHVVGEFVLAAVSGVNHSLEVTARMEVHPLSNAANFTSITRVAIRITQGTSKHTEEVYSNEIGRLESNSPYSSSPGVVHLGSFSVKVDVQRHPVLALSLHIPRNAQVTGLLNIDRDNELILENSTALREEAKKYQVDKARSPFSYTDSPDSSYEKFNPTNPPTTGSVNRSVNTSDETISKCEGEETCIADFILTQDYELAYRSRDIARVQRNAAEIFSNLPTLPPIISASTSVLHATFNRSSSIIVTARAAGARTITEITFEASTPLFSFSAKNVSSDSMELTWLPEERYFAQSHDLYLSVSAIDDTGAKASKTIPVTFCGCYGVCEQPPAADDLMLTFTQLGCDSCDTGRTGHNCADDLDSCVSNTCNEPHYECIDVPLPGDGFNCTCTLGFEDQKGSCVDVDECDGDIWYCGNGQCINTEGSYNCNCSRGHYWNGIKCDDVVEDNIKKPTPGDKVHPTPFAGKDGEGGRNSVGGPPRHNGSVDAASTPIPKSTTTRHGIQAHFNSTHETAQNTGQTNLKRQITFAAGGLAGLILVSTMLFAFWHRTRQQEKNQGSFHPGKAVSEADLDLELYRKPSRMTLKKIASRDSILDVSGQTPPVPGSLADFSSILESTLAKDKHDWQ
ncbi:uncharacterized protein LOC135812115 [Sycon ciliatum]|uniref:uncharacterized protein LOC135812115 n=1 Tax=Sycon ciliatum TaxID=27933 RepID=UPI0031F6216B